ncbi:MAG TPA: hypothetical protein PLQ87_08720 [Phycisphaerae bacterium]|nr:hypothetical protein [Phycisphaerae bacterium]
MPIECVEKFESRQVTTGQNPSVELRYVIRGTNSDVEARAALLAGSPATYDPWGSGWFYLPRDTVTVQPVGDLLWEGIVRYGPVPQTEQSVFNFDTGGGTQHITHALATVARYAPPGKTAPDCKGAIGVTTDSVEGVDITVPVYQFSETHYLADTLVTPAYKATLFGLTGKVNSAGFKGFAAGEVLFLGAAGSKRGSGDWEITYRFAASPNVTNLTIGDITGINKKGWEYLWVRYSDSEDTVAKALVKKPVAVYIEQVYPYGDLGLLGI